MFRLFLVVFLMSWLAAAAVFWNLTVRDSETMWQFFILCTPQTLFLLGAFAFYSFGSNNNHQNQF